MVQQQHGAIVRDSDQGEMACQRSQIYWFLSEFFLKPPDAAFVSGLKQRLANVTRPQPQELTLLAESLTDSEANEDRVLRLAIEYTRLFHGLQEGYGPPPPYESLYRPGWPGEAAMSVGQFYLRSGFDMMAQCRGPQDHLGVELRFMALLCHEEAQAFQRKEWKRVAELRQRQDDFLEQHLARWCFDYCHRLVEATREHFYRAVATITATSIKRDLRILRG